GTTAASLRAGIPTLALWSSADQPYWAAAIKRLKLGTARRFSATSQETLFADLRQILAPEFATRTREFAARMSTPAASIERTADLMEAAAARRKGID
ncbi:glycosyltransferase, partial [Mycobacterium colombiense]|uniref:glycosyltransferase n=1 Tax=Mycobacterium colombiense TaxID=339268 RepID=UPI0035579E4E